MLSWAKRLETSSIGRLSVLSRLSWTYFRWSSALYFVVHVGVIFLIIWRLCEFQHSHVFCLTRLALHMIVELNFLWKLKKVRTIRCLSNSEFMFLMVTHRLVRFVITDEYIDCSSLSRRSTTKSFRGGSFCALCPWNRWSISRCNRIIFLSVSSYWDE